MSLKPSIVNICYNPVLYSDFFENEYSDRQSKIIVYAIKSAVICGHEY